LPNFTCESLVRLADELFRAAGVRAEDASSLAQILVKADERGYAGHGMVRVPFYLERVTKGQVRLDGEPKVVRDRKATAVVDGDNYFGQIAGMLAVRTAIAKARTHGVGVVGLIRSGHIGRLAQYVEVAADEGFIGMAMVSVGGSVAPYGGRQAVSGTNPVAYAIPGENGEHILLDFATSAMSQGTLQHYVATGQAIPPGVLLDAGGNPTTSYEAHAGPPRGAMLPFGGYKGSGVMLMADILGGILPGGGPGYDRGNRGQPGVNTALFQVIDVEEFLPADEFQRELASFTAFVRSREPAPGFDAILLPGDRARQAMRLSAERGVPIEEGLWVELQDWATRLGIGTPSPLSA
jgi:LDH2 family malate/lactate/ureidoglycolate dehydrogenase